MLSNKIKIWAGIFFLISSLCFTEIGFSDPVGEVFIGGNTWIEAQWGTSNKDDQIVLDTVNNTIHIVWTYSPPPPYAGRGISRYNSYIPGVGWRYSELGFDMFPGNYSHIQHTIMLVDTLGDWQDLEIGIKTRGYDKFRAWWDGDRVRSSQIDTTLGVDYVLMANSRNRRIHMLGLNGTIYNCLYHNSYIIEPFHVSGWVLFDTLTHLTYAVACSPISERTAISYFRQKHFGGEPWESVDQDVYLRLSSDGIQWSDRINITNFGYSDIFRPTIQNEVMFDYDDIAHVAFLTYETRLTPDSILESNPNMSFIWHWSEVSDSFTVAAYGWIQNPPDYSLGAMKYPVNSPQMAVNPRNGYIYLLYEAYNYDDMSIAQYPNADLWLTVSTDGGLNWATATNVTNTQTPDCIPGQCASEIQASMNELVNDTLHILYILDKDAGIYWGQNEGSLTEAKVVYQKIPASLIPTVPLLPQFSIRSDPRTDINPGESLPLPQSISFLRNYPNPFNSSTTISYFLSKSSLVNIAIYNLLGQKVATLLNENQSAGEHSTVWNANKVPSGMYSIKIKTNDFVETKKCLLLK